VKLTCELPDEARRSLSRWTCAELAGSLVTDGVIDRVEAFVLGLHSSWAESER
jgi:hypothetical protein